MNDALDQPPPPPPKKRKASTPFTARALAECRKRRWTAGIVERRIPFPKPQGTTLDLFGVIDVVAIADGRIVGIQVTSGGNHDARKDKILAEPRAREWIERGRGHLELWSWSKRGGRGARKLWTLRVEVFTAESWAPGFHVGAKVVNDAGRELGAAEASELFRAQHERMPVHDEEEGA